LEVFLVMKLIVVILLVIVCTIESKTNKYRRGSIPITIDNEVHNFNFFSDEKISDQATRFCAARNLQLKHSPHIQKRAEAYIRSLGNAPRNIKIVYPTYGATLYSHNMDPYVQVDLILSSQTIDPEGGNYEVQIFTMKDKVMSIPFEKRILENTINIYISNELFGTYYLEVRIFDRDRSIVIASDDSIFDVVPVSSSTPSLLNFDKNSIVPAGSSLYGKKIVIVSDLNGNMDGTRRVIVQQIDGLLHHGAHVEILDTSMSGHVGVLGRLLQTRFANAVERGDLTTRHVPVVIDPEEWGGSLESFDEKCVSLRFESSLDDDGDKEMLWKRLNLTQYWETSNADAVWLTNSGVQEDGNASMVDLIGHLARLKGHVKHRFMDIAANGLDEPTRKYLKRIFQNDPYPVVTNIAVNSKPLASQIPNLTDNHARVRMFRPAVNLTKFDLCFGVCAHLPSLPNLLSSLVRSQYLRKRCEIECCSEQKSSLSSSALLLSHNKVRILFLGRLVMPKAPGVLLKSIVRLPRRVRDRVELVFVGNGYLEHPLWNLAQHLNISHQVIISKGDVPHDFVPSVIASSDIFVFPSLYPEAFGIVCVEAMSLGLPVVGFGFGGSSDFLHHMETGLVASPPTPSGLAAALELLIESNRARLKIGKRAMKFVKQTYSISAARDRWLSVYEELV
jgi:glycosyltransferase involved in cell wall biosynthesis